MQVSMYTTQQEPCQLSLDVRPLLPGPVPAPADRMQGVCTLQFLPNRLSQSERELSS